MVVLGADGTRGLGWIVAELDEGAFRRWHHVPDATRLLQLREERGAATLTIDIPIGLPPGTGRREADRRARSFLKGAASSVFPAPRRSLLEHAGRKYSLALSEELGRISAQSFALVSKIKDVDDALAAAGPAVHATVVECHPEVSFRVLAGSPGPGASPVSTHVLSPKRSAKGLLERIGLAQAALGELEPDVPVAAGLDDALDALACAWTAQRWAEGEAEVLGDEVDGTGVPMRIVV